MASRSAELFQLAFLGDAFECLVLVLDPVLVVVAIGRKESYDLIGTVRSHMAKATRRKIDSFTELVLVFLQRCSPELESYE
jgi:hypothetical protein